MAESPDESFEVVDGEDTSCHSNISEKVPEETGDGVKRSFCCKKHKALFMTSSNSIRSRKFAMQCLLYLLIFTFLQTLCDKAAV